jgi:ketosteroid isomerase-like protein
MTTAERIKDIVRATYAARARDDLKGTMAAFAEDAVFEFNGEGTGLPDMNAPVVGKAEVSRVIGALIDNFHLADWTEIALLAEGDKAALHWRANVTLTANRRVGKFDVFDFFTFRGDQIIALRQSTDSAMIKALLAP